MFTNQTCSTCSFYSPDVSVSFDGEVVGYLPCALQPWAYPGGCGDWEFKPPLHKNGDDNEPLIEWVVTATYPDHGYAEAETLPLWYGGEYIPGTGVLVWIVERDLPGFGYARAIDLPRRKSVWVVL